MVSENSISQTQPRCIRKVRVPSEQNQCRDGDGRRDKEEKKEVQVEEQEEEERGEGEEGE